MTDTNSFDQQVVLITAAASGLGRGIAIDLARHGATVHVWDRDAQALAELSSDAKSENLAISTTILTAMPPRRYSASHIA